MLESTNKCLYLIIYKIINKKINDDGQDKENIRLTLLDILDTTVSKLDSAGHISGLSAGALIVQAKKGLRTN